MSKKLRPGKVIKIPVGKDVREWDSGGKRDTEVGKLDFEGFLSPLVIQRFGEYMNKNRTMKDGSIRDSDNWQKGFGKDHFKVCMKSMWRHFLIAWKLHREADTLGYSHSDCENIEVIEEALCGIIFNAMAYLHQMLGDRIDLLAFSKQEYIDDLKKIPGNKIGELE